MHRILALPLMLLATVGCGDVAAPPPAPLALVSTAPRLAAEDRVRVIAFDEPRLSGEYRVSRRGLLELPVVGAVAAADRTPYEVERVIEAELRRATPGREALVAVELLGARGAFRTALR